MSLRTKANAALLFFVAATATGCLDDLPDPSLIDKVRVLGIQASPPEVAEGGSTTLNALVVDPAGRPLQLRWYGCVNPDPGTGFGDNDGGQAGLSGGQGFGLDDPGDCASPAAVEAGLAEFLGEGPTVDVTIDEDFLNSENTLAAYGFDFGGDVDESFFAPLWSVSGVNYSIFLEVVTADGERLVSFKRINVSTASEPNTNPPEVAVLAARSTEDGPWPADGQAPGDSCLVGGSLTPGAMDVRLVPLNIPDPPEPYDVLVSGVDSSVSFEVVETEETLFYSYFSQAGSFSDDGTKSTGDPSVTWSFEEEPTEPFDLWVVVRDGRGGLRWCHQVFGGAPETE